MNTVCILLPEILYKKSPLIPRVICSRYIAVFPLPPCNNFWKVLLTLHDATYVDEGVVKYIQGGEVLDAQIVDHVY